MRTIIFVVLSLCCLVIASTPVSTPYCWTCPSGWAHWWDFGYTAPTNGDQCQCIQGTPTTTTKAATSTTTTTKSATTTSTTVAATTCPPVPTNCPCGVVLPAGSTCKRCKINCPSTTAAPTTTKSPTTTTKSPTTTTTKSPTTSSPVTTTNSPTTTTKSPTTTTTTTKAPISTPYCWTCPSGYSHWWEFGYSTPPGGDQCECILGIPSSSGATTTTTKAATTTTKSPTANPNVPISTPNCWTCASGYSHWWELGYTAPPTGDQCECVLINSNTPTTTTTNSPSSPTTTTTTSPSSPTSAPTNSLQRFLNLLTPNDISPGSVSFSPYVAPYSPWSGPPMDLIDSLGSILVKQTGYRTVLIYYTEPYLVGSCVRNGLNVFGIISLGADTTNNENLIQTAIATVQKYPNNMVGLVCGNELGMQLGVTASTAAIINNCITKVKAANLGIPVGVMDTFMSWTASGAWSAAANADWIGTNIYAWWDNMYIPPPFTCETTTNGPQITYNNYLKVQNLYPKTPVVLTEFGWPSCGAGFKCSSPNVVDGSTCAVANDANQKQFIQNLIDIFRKNQKPCNTFSAFREAWKGSNSADVNEYWGVCSGSPPYSCFNAPS